MDLENIFIKLISNELLYHLLQEIRKEELRLIKFRVLPLLTSERTVAPLHEEQPAIIT